MTDTSQPDVIGYADLADLRGTIARLSARVRRLEQALDSVEQRVIYLVTDGSGGAEAFSVETDAISLADELEGLGYDTTVEQLAVHGAAPADREVS